jgi:hypothetical protein
MMMYGGDCDDDDDVDVDDDVDDRDCTDNDDGSSCFMEIIIIATI